jgi:subfamily B ATP-binding cassette protein MsbA
VVADLRQQLFRQYVALPASFYDRFSSGQLISKLAYNSEQVANAATKSIVSAFRDVLLVVMLLAVMVSSNLKLTLVMLLLVPMIGLLVTVISKRFRKISHRIQDSMGNVSHVTEEAVTGHRVVKVFRGQEAENKRFQAVNDKTRRLHMRMEVTHLAGSSMVQVAAGMAIVLLMIIATRPGMLNDISAGTFTTIFWAMVGSIPPLKRLTTVQALPRPTVFSRFWTWNQKKTVEPIPHQEYVANWNSGTSVSVIQGAGHRYCTTSVSRLQLAV